MVDSVVYGELLLLDFTSFFPSLVCLSLSQPLLCLPVRVVMCDMAQRSNMVKGSPALTIACIDLGGYRKGVPPFTL
jgi:hypothetical protein